jgi:hypothetical protein
LLEFQQNGIERALINGEKVSADLLDAASDTIAMKRAKDIKSSENHEGKSALEDVGFGFGGCAHFGNQQENATVPLGKQQENRKAVASPTKAHRLKAALQAFCGDEGDVVVLLVGTEVANFVDHGRAQVLGRKMAVAAETLDQSIFAKLLLVGIERLGDAVGVED